jgi:hypothetical protein
MSGLGNGHRYGSIAKVSSCYVLCGVEMGGRARRGGAGVLIAATWEAGVARCRLGCWIRGATREEQVRKGKEREADVRLPAWLCVLAGGGGAVKERCGARSKARPRETGNSLPRTSEGGRGRDRPGAPRSKKTCIQWQRSSTVVGGCRSRGAQGSIMHLSKDSDRFSNNEMCLSVRLHACHACVHRLGEE